MKGLTSGRFGFKGKIVQGLNDAITEAQDAAISAGEWPKGLPLPKSRVETETYTANIYYTKNGGGKWVCEKTDKATGRIQTVSANTRGELALILLSAQALQTVENADIEAENSRIDAGLPEGIDGWEDEEHEEAVRFLNETRQGAEYQKAIEWLSASETEFLYEALRKEIKRLQLGFTHINLTVAYDSLLDSADLSFWKLIQKAKRLEREAAAQEEEANRLAIEESKLVPAEAASPSENIVTSAEVAARRKADAENRKLSFAELQAKVRADFRYGPTGRH